MPHACGILTSLTRDHTHIHDLPWKHQVLTIGPPGKATQKNKVKKKKNPRTGGDFKRYNLCNWNTKRRRKRTEQNKFFR